jgi:protein YIPF5/7
MSGFYDPNKQSNESYNSQLNFTEFVPSTNNQFYDPSNYFSPNSAPTFAPMPDWSQGGNSAFENFGSGSYLKQPQQPPNQFGTSQVDFEQEPPLLEELGINFEHIYRKTICVLNPFAKPHESIVHDEDLAGPLVFCIAYGFSLLLMGKVHFGFIYGITALGCLSMYLLLNLMSEKGVSAMCIGSTLGYCLLPMVLFSFISSLISLQGYYGLAVSILFILWCSISSSKLFVNALNMLNQQMLVLYPCFLLYGIFALLNVF